MKANGIPEKIYLQVCGTCKDNDCKNCKFEDLVDITWCKDKIFEKDIEYTRTDAFVEKIVKWIESTFSMDYNESEMNAIIKELKEYMKGEWL